MFEIIAEIQSIIQELNIMLNINTMLTVDEENAIVYHGEDVFYIQPNKLEEYLIIKLKKMNLLLEASKKTEIDPQAFADVYNRLTFQAAQLYRR